VLAVAFLAWKGDKVANKLVDLRFGAVLPKAAYPAPKDSAEAYRQDLDYLDRLTSVDRSFSAPAAARFHERIADLKSGAQSLSRAQFFLGVAEAVALADNAHTSVDADAWRGQLEGAPLRLQWFEEGLHVVRAAAPYEELRGKRVLQIDGIDPAVLEREAAHYFGGPPEHARVSSPMLMESPEALNALHPEVPSDRMVVRVAVPGGGERVEEVPAIPVGRDTDLQWFAARDASAEKPPSLRGADRNAYVQRLADGVLYLHLWKIRDEPGRPLENTVRDALGLPGDPPWKRIILDLRFDGGGEVPAIHGAMKALPARLAPDGKLLILQDHTTFSAAIIAAALAKHFTGPRALIVGEKPGDRLAFWAEGNDIRLPNSKIRVTTATGYHDWAHGCRDLRCFWPNFLYTVGVGNVDPDVAVRWSFEDYAKGVDTVLNRALQI
jgi:hypothetical protein